ncbi:hypothetical protein [Streptomyces sp. NPDC001933]|uniref:hypothetical protein n=1 Tax=Streptomyces sp. NPDC001933 TaxID=3364626 RepID=UPI0036B881EF
MDEPERGRIDVLWWACALVGPGAERLLVLAADVGWPGGDQRYPATCLYALYDPIRSEVQIADAFETATVWVRPGDRLILCTVRTGTQWDPGSRVAHLVKSPPRAGGCCGGLAAAVPGG